MQRNDLKLGGRYGFRDSRQLGEPVLEVEFIDYVPRVRKAKIRHLGEPHEGLTEYVPLTKLLCSWKDAKRLLRDEQREAELLAAAADDGFGTPIRQAINIVLASSGEDIYLHHDDIMRCDKAAAERIVARCGSDPPGLSSLAQYPSFLNRRGVLHVRGNTVLAFARAFAAAEPEAVNLYVDQEEQEYRSRGYEIGGSYLHKIMLENGPAYALARQWAGGDQSREYLQNEIRRLRELVQRAVADLRRHGDDSAAGKLERALGGG
ncbi:MAG: hypothetical protein ACJ735_07475 [Actinomycetes bacterium]